MASTGRFDLRICPFGILPPGSQVVRAPSFGSLCGGTLCLLLPLLGLLCGGTLTSCLRPALSCARGANTSGSVAVAISALPVGLTPAVPSAWADAAPTTGSAPPCLCASMPEGLSSSALVFLATPGSPKGSRSPRRKGESPNADTPPDFSRTSICKSGGFQSLGQ